MNPSYLGLLVGVGGGLMAAVGFWRKWRRTKNRMDAMLSGLGLWIALQAALTNALALGWWSSPLPLRQTFVFIVAGSPVLAALGTFLAVRLAQRSGSGRA